MPNVLANEAVAVEEFNMYITRQLTGVIMRTMFKAKELDIEIVPSFIDVSLDHNGYLFRTSLIITGGEGED